MNAIELVALVFSGVALGLSIAALLKARPAPVVVTVAPGSVPGPALAPPALPAPAAPAPEVAPAAPPISETEKLNLIREAALDGILLAKSAKKKNLANGVTLADTDLLRIAVEQFTSRVASHGLPFTASEAAKLVEIEFLKQKGT